LIANHAYDLISDDCLSHIPGVGSLRRFHLTLEGFSAGGSIKPKTARGIVQDVEDAGVDLSRTRNRMAGARRCPERVFTDCPAHGKRNCFLPGRDRAPGPLVPPVAYRNRQHESGPV
jgi:hypothetical protein